MISAVTQHEFFIAQTRLASPALLKNLLKAEHGWRRLLELVETL